MHIGSQIRSFRIERLVGSGGMGSVYCAKDVGTQDLVAVKVLNPSLSSNSEMIRRFLREAEIQSRLVHKNIVNMRSFFENDGAYYIVMDYCDGLNLKDLIRNCGSIPEVRSLKLLKQILAGLEYAHSKGIVHRDIKPSNIMISANDQVSIMDFGIAKALGSMEQLTKTGLQIGTVAYMSPEQIINPKSVDSKSDIYSCGVLLFEMLTGKLPYKTGQDSEFAIQKEIVSPLPLPDPRVANPHLSDKTVLVLNAMTQKDPANRASASQVLTALQSRSKYPEKFFQNQNDMTRLEETTLSPEPVSAKPEIVFEGKHVSITSDSIILHYPKDSKPKEKTIKLHSITKVYKSSFLPEAPTWAFLIAGIFLTLPFGVDWFSDGRSTLFSLEGLIFLVICWGIGLWIERANRVKHTQIRIIALGEDIPIVDYTKWDTPTKSEATKVYQMLNQMIR